MVGLHYQRTLVGAPQSEDGETPTTIQVTKEVNFYALTLTSCDGLLVLGTDRYSPNRLIEQAVNYRLGDQ